LKAQMMKKGGRRCGFIFVLAILLLFCLGVGFAARSETILSPRTVKIKYVTDRKEINYVVDQFRSRLRLLNPNVGIIACDHMTEVIEEGIKDISFGAVCTVQNGNDRLTVLMCGDSLGASFTWEPSGSLKRESVINFIKSNCSPVK